MIRKRIGLALVVCVGGGVLASGAPPFPKTIPPMLGTAVVNDQGESEKSSEWRIGLTIPKIRWEVVGEIVPKQEWPKVRASVEQVGLILRMGGPSQLAESRIVDIKGKDLSREEIRARLARETPVLVSVSGEMPEAYFLQLTSADALIVLLGPRDGQPAPDLLAAKKEPSAGARKASDK